MRAKHAWLYWMLLVAGLAVCVVAVVVSRNLDAWRGRGAVIPASELHYTMLVPSPSGKYVAANVVRIQSWDMDRSLAVGTVEGSATRWRNVFDWPWPHCGFRDVRWASDTELLVAFGGPVDTCDFPPRMTLASPPVTIVFTRFTGSWLEPSPR